ncbi:MAG: flagellar biosynthetic protein FliO [Gammaproteobacteria bacterium]|nr:flagellar biosynthetic protein FliO [Gammaproteobacteria bacterium]MCP5202283.1 flagellar biosynthetic protein FliO [Gammaproteobacteria bacterium]
MLRLSRLLGPGAALNALPAHAADGLAAGQAMQVFAGLAVVLALIAAASWGARRLQGLRPQGRGRIRVLEGLSLGAREKLLLVEVDERRVLIGICPGRMQALASFDGVGPAPAFDAVLGEAREVARS